MTRPDPHQRFSELAAGHAMHALEPEDELVFLQHLPSCARCERDTAVHRETLSHLAYAPDDVEPPASLLDGIRAGVLASGRDATFPDQAGPDTSPPVIGAEPAPERSASEPLSLDGARRRRDEAQLRRAGTWTAVAAAAALVIGLGAWNADLRSDREAQDAWGDRMTAAVSQLQDDGTQAVPLDGPGGDVVAVALVRGGELSLVVDGLPVNEPTSTYVLWGQSRYGDVRPVGAFDVERAGVDVHRDMQVQAGVADVTRFMVTEEEGDGVPALPRAAVIASGDL